MPSTAAKRQIRRWHARLAVGLQQQCFFLHLYLARGRTASITSRAVDKLRSSYPAPGRPIQNCQICRPLDCRRNSSLHDTKTPYRFLSQFTFYRSRHVASHIFMGGQGNSYWAKNKFWSSCPPGPLWLRACVYRSLIKATL